MATASASSPLTLAPSSASPSEQSPMEDRDAPQQELENETKKEVMYKTKTIQFLGRSTPIILQNENGPCPLLAICNVLLLRNNLNLNPDSAEVSQEKLLSLVAERLIDSNCNVDNKDKGYLENQEQNIADAIEILPHLATGIDVNIRFRRIDDFEYTRECAIFDLLDIPLYHGWIVDPQDVETANAIGSKSYNALMGELVALETQNVEVFRDQNPGEDSVDFVAATTAALGVPSPSLSKTRSFDDSPPVALELRKLRKGDLEEEAELLKALELSEKELPTSMHDDTHVDTSNEGSAFVCSDEIQWPDEDVLVNFEDNAKAHPSTHPGSICQSDESKSSEKRPFNISGTMIKAEEEACSTSSTTKSDGAVDCDQSSSKESGEQTVCDGGIENSSKQTSVDDKVSSEMHIVEKINHETTPIGSSFGTLPTFTNVTSIVPSEHPPSLDRNLKDVTREGEIVTNQSTAIISIPEQAESVPRDVRADVSGLSVISAPQDSSGKSQHDDVPSELISSIGSGEPIYEGEECVNPGSVICEDKEPVYEGETVLTKKAEKNAADDSSQVRGTDGLTLEEGYLIRTFLKYSASQLTFCGLFRLQEGLKERELCVFFRNNHFSTMFKYEGELYLLATDQGYLNQPDLVWEKLNEVNGDTLFMTGDFKVFKVDSGNTGGTWDEQNVMTSTADYLASINSSSDAGNEINPDLQLAIALQKQEFEQQSPRNNTPSQPPASASRLVTGPQVPRNSYRPSSAASASSKPEGKSSKEKCTVM